MATLIIIQSILLVPSLYFCALQAAVSCSDRLNEGWPKATCELRGMALSRELCGPWVWSRAMARGTARPLPQGLLFAPCTIGCISEIRKSCWSEFLVSGQEIVEQG